MIIDTGSTGTFVTVNLPLKNKRKAATPIIIRNPNGQTMTSEYEGELDLPQLPPAARHARIVKDLKNHSLLSVGVLCDAGCKVSFQKDLAEVIYNGEISSDGPSRR